MNKPRHNGTADREEAGAVIGADGQINSDLPCAGCDYNLRGLRLSSDCPECGRPAGDAVKRLAETPERWLRRVSLGAWLIAGGALLRFLMLGAFCFVAFFDMFDGGWHEGILLLIAFPLAVGVRLFVVAEPGSSPRNRHTIVRGAVRAVWWLEPLLFAAIPRSFESARGLSATAQLTMEMLPAGWGTVHLAGLACVCWLAHRRLVRLGRSRAANIVVGAVAYAALPVLMMLINWTYPEDPLRYYVLFVSSIGGLILVAVFTELGNETS